MAGRKPISEFRGHLLRMHRERAGLSIVAVAKRCRDLGHDVHVSAIGKVENGVNGPSPELLKALAGALEIKVKDLLEDGAAG